VAVASALAVRAGAAASPVAAGARLRALLPGAAARDQRVAAATALLRPFTVIAGGPGTGKTTTIGAILALLER